MLDAAVLNRYPQADCRAIQALLKEKCREDGHKIVVLDDDPTGVQTVHDVSVYTDWSYESIKKGFEEDNKLFYILTNSRGFTVEQTTRAHLEIGENVARVSEETGIEVKERVPDSVIQEADEVVNIDLTAEELITRLKAGKIYRPEKIQTALDNFFRAENILQLRELALKEVALRVEKKVENEVVMGVAVGLRHEKFLACISSHEKTPRRIIRKAARLATRYNTTFIALYVQTPKESMDRIDLARQRYLLNHFKLVTELGGEVLQVQSRDILESIVKACKDKQISTVCMGSPDLRLPGAICSVLKYRRFLNNLSQANIDLIILA